MLVGEIAAGVEQYTLIVIDDQELICLYAVSLHEVGKRNALVISVIE